MRKNESIQNKKSRAGKILSRLKKTYPDARCALDYSNPMELLAATILSAQCTDVRVNKVTPALFKRYPSVRDYAQADLEELKELVKTTGFYSNKARNIKGAAAMILEEHGGEVPAELDKLVKLPGVGRKTANVVLGNAFGIPGLTVDTHMIRLNNRLGFTRQKDPVKIEYELMKIIPQKEWTMYSHFIIHHGRNRCSARRPDCAGCELREWCPSKDSAK